jgi:hypothetical protein
MAITRAQQAKQLLALGGRIGLQGGGADMGKDKGPETGRAGRDDREIGARMSRTAAAARAATKAKTALGDPDPEVDVLTKNRLDTITNYGKNLSARFRSNPFSVGPFGVLENIRQTQKAREILGLSNEPDDFGPDKGEEGIIPVDTTFGGAVTSTPQAPAVSPSTGQNLNRIAYRLMADGGAVIDDEPRQAYGLGSIVKKATRAVKKVVKSDIGKAAIAAAGIYYAGGGNLFGLQRTTPLGKFAFSQLPGAGLFGKTISEKTAADTVARRFVPNTLGSMFQGGTGLATAGILAASALPLLGIGVEEDEEEDKALDPYLGEGLDIAAIRADPRKFQGQAYRLMAEGGDTEDAKEPVAKKVMPLIDMGGKEKDYRETGGFVDMGRMEKADDVPARLSKNEFVFTADAVRNAGDGSVDKGAEVMYNMMKNLEAGGEVSEESQGLEGARKMFQTSQRLEEVL